MLRGLTEEEHGCLDWFESDEYTKVHPARPRARLSAHRRIEAVFKNFLQVSAHLQA